VGQLKWRPVLVIIKRARVRRVRSHEPTDYVTSTTGTTMTTSHAHRGTPTPTETWQQDRVHRAVGAAIRDLIRRDPELWRRVQADPPPAADEEPGEDRA
jgi:hypothetical protein